MTKLRKGGRPRVGSTFIKDGIRQIAVSTTLPGAKQPRWVRPARGDDGALLNETDARLLAAKLQRAYDAGAWDPWAPVAPVAQGETVCAWFLRWATSREAAGLHTVSTDRGRFDTHLRPILGALPIASVTRAQIEDVRDALDARCRAGELATNTAARAWSLMAKMFRDARASKDRSLRVRDDNPCTDVEPPDRGAGKAGTYLYPTELLDLVTCARVPVALRRVYVLAVYLHTRGGELEALEWDSIDLERGVVHVHQAVDSETGEVRETKTGIARRFSFEPALVPLLRAMHREAGGRGRVVPVWERNNAAELLRAHLALAGVTRPELFARSKTRRPLDFHDLRATALTWMAVRGDEPLRIQQRAGHTSFATTQGYVRAAEAVRGGDFGAVFPPLPGCVIGGSATASATPAPVALETRRENELSGGRKKPGAESGADRPGTESFAKPPSEFASGDPLETPAGGNATGSATPVAERWSGRVIAHLAQSEASALAMLAWLGAAGQPGGEA